jgi:hypothetical protein
MSKNEEFEVKSARDALSLLTHKVYARYGSEALDIIKDVWYKLGIFIGEGMKRNLPDTRLVTAGQSFIDSGRKRGTKIDILEMDDKKVHIKAYRCALGLKGKGRELCLACMGCDQGIFEGATGSKIKVDVIKSLADPNDDCCEVSYIKV